MLTARQLQTLQLIAECRMRTGISPTMQQLAIALGITHRAGAWNLVCRLREKGMLTRGDGTTVNIALTDAGRKQLPNRCPHCGATIYV